MIIMNNGSYLRWLLNASLLLIAKCTLQNNLRVEKRNKIQDVDWERKFKSQTINVKFDLL